jgi:ATP-dependent helicase/nuclease subunit A
MTPDSTHERLKEPRSLAVTAGAGTGKTTLLARRYVAHLKAHGLSPLEVVAVTFTEKAAAELRGRIRREVSAGDDGEDLQAELEAAQISTIHALAARICRDHPEEAGVPADFGILDELEGKLWLKERLEQILDEIPTALYEVLPYTSLRGAVEALLDDPVAALQALECGPGDWAAVVERERKKARLALLESQAWRTAQEVLPFHSGAEGDLIETFRRQAIAAMTRVEKEAGLEAAVEELRGLKPGNSGKAANWPDGSLPAVRAAIIGLREAVKAAVGGLLLLRLGPADEELERRLTALQEAYRRCADHVAAQKRRARVLDFSDLEVHALRALEQPQVREHYHLRWKAFLVDEFQDVNPVQAEILKRLAGGSALLTLVGDEKQSIYGFRRADVAVFQRCRQEISQSGGETLQLSRSYRTHHELIGGLNALFAPVLESLHQPLSAARIEAPHPAPHVRAWCVSSEGKLAKARLQRVEARRIARALKRMLDEGVLIHDRHADRDEDALRPVQPGDIAVLARAWEPLDLYGEVLAAHDIAAVHMGGGDLLGTREAADGGMLLRFLANREDDLALAALLRGPFLAVSDRVLFCFSTGLREKGRWWSALREADLRREGMPELVRPVEVLDRLLKEARTEPPARVLQSADRATGYTAVIRNLPGGDRRLADWRGFLDLVRKLEQQGLDLFAVVRRLRKMRDAELEVPRPALEAGNAVSLLSIHASKGLEWPVVVLPDLSRQAPPRAPSIRFDAALGVALRWRDAAGEWAEPALYRILEQEQQRREEEEARRLYYVACTRARDHLLLTAAKEKGGAYDFLAPALTAAGVRIEPEPATDETLRVLAPRMPPLPPAPERFLPGPLGAGLWELPVTALTDYARCPRRFRFRYVEGHPGLAEGDGAPRRIGSLTHLALQLDVQDAALLARYDPELAPEHVATALALAERVREVPAFAALCGQADLREERVRLRQGGLVLHGIVDVVGPDFVLDYKTDARMRPEEHLAQLSLYALAAGKPTAHVAYLRHDLLHTWTPGNLAAGSVAVEALIAGIRQGEFAPRPSLDACSACAYASICEDRVSFEDNV